jgi:Na+-transporting methylmalonyl-CoA/oxaloacetate decarboxylase gamma subunit
VIGALLLALDPVGRDDARDAARRELSKGLYHRNDPSLIDRVLQAISNWLNDRFRDAANVTPGGMTGVFVVLALLVLIAGVVLWWFGPLRRTTVHRAESVELTGPLHPDEHRRAADRFAAQGRYAEAVRERMRAIVRELEDRGVLEPRPGRTADEVAWDAGDLVPSVAVDLRNAAHIFDQIWYGGRVATPALEASMREADQRVRSAQLVVPPAGAETAATAGYRVPS